MHLVDQRLAAAQALLEVRLLEPERGHAEVERPDGRTRTDIERDVRCVGRTRQCHTSGRGVAGRSETGPRNGLGGRRNHGTVVSSSHIHSDGQGRASGEAGNRDRDTRSRELDSRPAGRQAESEANSPNW
jgi:hypothetical protein